MSQNRPLYLGPRLRRLRRELGLTQQAMAADLDISPSYVALIERNQRPVTADMLLRLARTYRLDVSELAGADAAEDARRVSKRCSAPDAAECRRRALGDLLRVRPTPVSAPPSPGLAAWARMAQGAPS